MSEISDEEFIIIIARALDITITQATAIYVNHKTEIGLESAHITKFIFDSLSQSDGYPAINSLIQNNPDFKKVIDVLRNIQARGKSDYY